MRESVAAVVVSHDGERWLPATLRHLHEQTRRPDLLLGVDAGSADSSADLLVASLGEERVLRLPAVGLPTAVDAALDALLQSLPPDQDGHEDGWVWLLHDDSAPAPDALEALLDAARDHPEAHILGPKLREWPSLRRILEVGVTVSGTGRRETGLERGEYDQGQHDEPRTVLAVNTAGMLIRRSTLATLRLDPALPLHHTDLDLGWRAARQGYAVRTAPAAVVFHAEASRGHGRGARTGQPTSAAHRRRDERASAAYLLLANSSSALVPFVAARVLLGGLLRALALMLVRAPREAWGELLALGRVAGHPALLLRARRARAAAARVPHRAVRGLLAPWWAPYRHGLDELAEIAVALGRETAEVATRHGGGGLARRVATSPGVLVVLALVVGSLVAARDLLGAGTLSGGALLPAPDSAWDWWRSHLAGTHLVWSGSAQSAPAYLLPLALAGTVLLGSAGLVLDLLVLFAVPLAGLGSYRLLTRLGAGRGAAAWGAAAYGLLLPASGAVGQGRFGSLAAALLLPWLVGAALRLLADEVEARRRAVWRSGLLLAAVAAFSPLTALAAGLALALVAAAGGTRPPLRAVAGVLGIAAGLLLPTVVLGPLQQGGALLLDAGLPSGAGVGDLGLLDALGARAGEPAAPIWAAGLVVVAALLALLRPSTRTRTAACWAFALGGLLVALASFPLQVTPVATGRPEPLWLGGPLLLAHGAWVAAAALGASGVRGELVGRSFGLRQVAGIVAAVAALVGPATAAAWWVAADDSLLQRAEVGALPAYLADRAERDPSQGVLLLTGDAGAGYTYDILRGPSHTVGDDALRPEVDPDDPLVRALADVVAGDASDLSATLTSSGLAAVFAPAPVDPPLAEALDATSGLAPASAGEVALGQPVSRAWAVEGAVTLPRVEAGAVGAVRPVLVALQLLWLVAVLALAAPETRGRR